MYRVNYLAKKFGFVGWDAFTNFDRTVMDKVVPFEYSRMSKLINEKVIAQILEY